MASVVIIHAADDALPARALGEKLRAARLTPVFEMAPGAARQDAVKNAAVTVALWSPRSVQDQGVVEDVAFARTKGKLLHATMQSVQPPDTFRREQWVDLTGWRGEDDFKAWRDLARLVAEKAGVAPMPPPAPRPPSGFFQPGRVGAAPAQSAPQQPLRAAPAQAASRAPPPPRAAPPPRPVAPPPRMDAPRPPPPRENAMRQEPAREGKAGGSGMIIAIAAFAVIAAAGAGGYFVWSQSQGSQASATAWEDVDRNDAASLRAFIDGNPGALRAEAQTALSELEERSFEAASDADSIDALQAFLADFPDSAHGLAARGRIAELQTLQNGAAPAVVEDVAPVEGGVDPDLVPPGTAPDGPVQLAPPAPETPENGAEPEPAPPPG